MMRSQSTLFSGLSRHQHSQREGRDSQMVGQSLDAYLFKPTLTKLTLVLFSIYDTGTPGCFFLFVFIYIGLSNLRNFFINVFEFFSNTKMYQNVTFISEHDQTSHFPTFDIFIFLKFLQAQKQFWKPARVSKMRKSEHVENEAGKKKIQNSRLVVYKIDVYNRKRGAELNFIGNLNIQKTNHFSSRYPSSNETVN